MSIWVYQRCGLAGNSCGVESNCCEPILDSLNSSKHWEPQEELRK